MVEGSGFLLLVLLLFVVAFVALVACVAFVALVCVFACLFVRLGVERLLVV